MLCGVVATLTAAGCGTATSEVTTEGSSPAAESGPTDAARPPPGVDATPSPDVSDEGDVTEPPATPPPTDTGASEACVGGDCATPRADAGEATADSDAETEAESDACIGPECDTACGPSEVAEDGVCVCDDTTCRDSWTGGCITRWIDKDFASLESQKVSVLVPRQPELIANFVDLDQIHANIHAELDEVMALIGTDDWMWQAFGYQLFATPLCSMFQFSATDWSPEHVAAVLQTVRDEPFTSAYMSLVLSSIISNRVDVCALHDVANAFESELTTYLADGVDVTLVKGSFARYLLTLDLYDEALNDDLVATVRAALYPSDTIEVQGVWDSELVFDLVLAGYLDLEFDALAVVSALDAWWQPFGGVELADCYGVECTIKGIHQVVLIDAIHGLVPEDKLVEIASLLFSNIGSDGSLGFPAVLGISPSILWTPSYCDVFCSAKHWHFGMAMNHLADKLAHREEDIKAGAAMLAFDVLTETTPETLSPGADCVIGAEVVCTPTEYCRPEGCGVGLPGICTPRPESCIPGNDSVCACNGNTYGSACHAAQAGQLAVGVGSCPQATLTCNVEATIWGAGTGCALDEYCFGGCIGAGFCKPKPVCGTEPVTLKCGCDGLTYQNACTLASAGQNLAHEGWCVEPENPIEVEGCGGELLVECSDPGMACDPQSCEPNAEGYCLNLGQPQPGAEEAIYCTPFPSECGCDDVTYANQCERVEAGIALQYPGPCGDGGVDTD
jgi:hypothetical protein